MEWVKYQTPPRNVKYSGLRVSNQSVRFTNEFWRIMNCPREVEFFFDKTNNAIAVKPVKENGFTINPLSRSSSVKLYRVMPLGIYKFQQQLDDKYVCLFSEEK